MKKLIIAFLFVLAAATVSAQQKVVLLDSYFNNEFKKDTNGKMVSFHYKWDDLANSGFSVLGKDFEAEGAELATLHSAPNKHNLKNATIYIIVDPDTEKETTSPKYIQSKDVKQIAKWVKKGGVLFLLANDSANTELAHFNTLADKFGIHFNDDLVNHVTNDAHFEEGAAIPTNKDVFKSSSKVFMKDACSISIKNSAFPILESKGAILIAANNYGKGYVLVVGDPWLYNEYVNGRLPSSFQNDLAAKDISSWLMDKASKKNK